MLEYGNKKKWIHGFDIGINNSSAVRICKDKSATSELLSYYEIACVEHKLFQIKNKYYSTPHFWEAMIEYLNAYKSIVAKPNEGSGGWDLYRITNQKELENAILRLTQQYNDITLSPFIDVEHEYRVVVLNNLVLGMYKKSKPYVLGDGEKTIFQLLNKFNILNIQNFSLDLNTIPQIGEKVELGWKHNSSQGGKNEIFLPNENYTLYYALESVAIKASSILDLNFCAVDIFYNSMEKKAQIIEVNHNVRVEWDSENFYKKAKDIYKEALKFYFSIP